MTRDVLERYDGCASKYTATFRAIKHRRARYFCIGHCSTISTLVHTIGCTHCHQPHRILTYPDFHRHSFRSSNSITEQAIAARQSAECSHLSRLSSSIVMELHPVVIDIHGCVGNSFERGVQCTANFLCS